MMIRRAHGRIAEFTKTSGEVVLTGVAKIVEVDPEEGDSALLEAETDEDQEPKNNAGA